MAIEHFQCGWVDSACYMYALIVPSVEASLLSLWVPPCSPFPSLFSYLFFHKSCSLTLRNPIQIPQRHLYPTSLCVSFWSSLGFLFWWENTTTKSNLEKKGFISAYSLTAQSITERGQYRNTKVGTEAETMGEPWLLALSPWLAQSDLLYTQWLLVLITD